MSNHKYVECLSNIVSNTVWLHGAYDENNYERSINKPKLKKAFIDEYGEDLGHVLFAMLTKS